MGFDTKEMIEKLKFEIEMIERGRYFPSVHEPRGNPEIFRDTITCLNAGLEQKKYPCSSCFLSEFVPAEFRDSTGTICHKIPLNDKDDTIESLAADGDPYKLQEAVLGWLKNTVRTLEQKTLVIT